MRCPHCGATNPESAAWCGQCYRRFDHPDVAPRLNGHGHDQPHDAAVGPARVGAATADSGFRREGDRVEWECPTCGHYSPMDLQHCERCQTSFLERFRTEEPEPPRNWNQALLLTAVVPGAGHIAVDRYGTGIARAALFVSWILAAVLLGPAAGGRAAMVVGPLLLGALVLWAGSIVDVYRLSQGQRELLAGRPMLWLVAGVLLLMGVGLVASLAAVTRQ
ncbi:MAG TPA: hypothetical protein VM307_15920 [Egibacteraceae bacterium]|nr:hypothetical protein [Egibacteraceae bacterium]